MKYLPQLLFSLIVLAIGAGIMSYLIATKPIAEKKEEIVHIPRVRSFICSAFNQTVTIRSQGTVRAFRENDISSEIDGEIIKLSDHFINGHKVSKGHLLLSIEPEPYQLAVQKSKAQLAQAQLSLSQEQAQGEQARIDWIDSGRDIHTANDLVLRKPQLAMAVASVDAATADVRQAQRRLERCLIYAPYDGYIEQTNVGLGQFIRAGTALGHIIASNKVEVPIPVQNTDLLFIDMQTTSSTTIPVTLYSDIGQKRHSWQGTITRFLPRISGRHQQFIAIAEIDKPFDSLAPLLPDLFVEAHITGKKMSGLMEIPRSSIRDGSYVWMITSEHKLNKRDITIVHYNPQALSIDYSGETALITSTLQTGERIVLNRLTVMGENMLVDDSTTHTTPSSDTDTDIVD